MTVRVAINGFGRTGRAAFRAAHEREADIEWVAINDVADPAMLAQLLRNDTVYGRFGGSVEVADARRREREPGEDVRLRLRQPEWSEVEGDRVCGSLDRRDDFFHCRIVRKWTSLAGRCSPATCRTGRSGTASTCT